MDKTDPARTPPKWPAAAWVGFMIAFLACKILCAFSERIGPWG